MLRALSFCEVYYQFKVVSEHIAGNGTYILCDEFTTVFEQKNWTDESRLEMSV